MFKITRIILCVDITNYARTLTDQKQGLLKFACVMDWTRMVWILEYLQLMATPVRCPVIHLSVELPGCTV